MPSVSRPRLQEIVTLQVMIVPRTVTPMNGTIKFEVDPLRLALQEGRPVQAIADVRRPVSLPEVPLKYVPLQAGPAVVRAVVETAYGVFDNEVTLDVQAPSAELCPRHHRRILPAVWEPRQPRPHPGTLARPLDGENQ